MSQLPLDRRQFVATVASAVAAGSASAFQSAWTSQPDQPWLGPDYWANPLQDWRLRQGRIECFVPGGDRNVFLLTREVTAAAGDLTMSVRLGRLPEDHGKPIEDGFAGFRVGIRGHFNDYRDSAVRGFGLNAGIAADGRLFIGTLEAAAPKVALADEMHLRLRAAPTGESYAVTLEALDASGRPLGEVRRAALPADWLTGGVALVCSSGPVEPTPLPLEPSGGAKPGTNRGGTLRFWFRDWSVSGSKVAVQEDRAFGPILFAMHTLSRRVLKLTAQMAPVNGSEPVRLQVRSGGGLWQTIATSPIDPLARTATFRVANWNDTRDTPYRVLYSWRTGAAAAREVYFDGVIRKDPRDRKRLTIGALTCNNDFGFPHQDIADSVRHFSPDILLFTGDQIYEGVAAYGIQTNPLETAALDYLRKWYLFGWAYRDLMRELPTVAIPDDHDVYHGNVWGAEGKAAELASTDLAKHGGFYSTPNAPSHAIQDSGGYKMPAAWVNMVQRTQTSHLPNPFDPTPVQQGITVYYTSLLYGGVSFAILEDRKWKSAPRALIPWANIQNGWAQNPEYDPARHGDAKGAELLGARQIEFLEEWAQDWDGAYLKIVVSQTIFANVATLPKPANTDAVTPKLPILPTGDYPEGEVHVADHDSNGWPQSGRHAALRAMRKGCAFHIGGDQHLGSTVQYGIEDWGDAGWVLCTPAISNVWPRRWYPPKPGANRKPDSPRYTGDFLDAFGNRMTVHAVSNPAQFGVEPAGLFNRAVGYGIVEVDLSTRRLTIANWPRHVNPAQSSAKPYPGWPITIHQFDNGLTGARFVLEEVRSDTADPVVQVVKQASGEVVYTVRAEGRAFTPPVYEAGVYTVRLIDSGGRTVWEFKDRQAKPRSG